MVSTTSFLFLGPFRGKTRLASCLPAPTREKALRPQFFTLDHLILLGQRNFNLPSLSLTSAFLDSRWASPQACMPDGQQQMEFTSYSRSTGLGFYLDMLFMEPHAARKAHVDLPDSIMPMCSIISLLVSRPVSHSLAYHGLPLPLPASRFLLLLLQPSSSSLHVQPCHLFSSLP